MTNSGTPIDRPDRLPASAFPGYEVFLTRRIFNDLQWSVFDFLTFAKLAVASVCFWQVIPEA